MKKLLIFLLITSINAFASIDINKIYIVANADIANSMLLAEKYCELRGVPKKNIISFSMPKTEEISFKAYEILVDELANALEERQAMHSVKRDGQRLYLTHNIDFLISCYGVPLKVKGTNIEEVKKRGGMFSNATAFDSAVSSLFLAYENKRILNPSFKNKDVSSQRKAKIIRVARLAGKDYKTSLAIIENALYVEENGLIGRAYVDDSTQITKAEGYLKYAENILSSLGYDTSISPKTPLMDFTQRFDAVALYFGWYTSNPCYYFTLTEFEMQKGSVAMHLHSFSMSSQQRGWTSRLIEKNASASVGNVYEPYLGLVHNFNLYIEALLLNFTAGEASYYASPALRWQNIFVGDPLYLPFKHSLAEQVKDIDAGKISKNSQYVIIRAMNLLEKKGETQKAIVLALKSMDIMENTALTWKLSQIYEKEGKNAVAISYATALLDTLANPSNSYFGLNYEVAKYLSEKGLNKEALKLVENHIEANFKNAYYLKNTLPIALKYAILTKDDVLVEKFSKKLKEITPKVKEK